MPRALSASMISYIAEQSGFASIALLDLQTVDGTEYFWTDNDYNQWPVAIGNGFNMIADPDTMAAWTNVGLTALVAGAGLLRGSAWKYVGTGAASGFLYAYSQVITVVPGQTYTLSGYIDATNVVSGLGTAPQWTVFDPTIVTNYGGVAITPGLKQRVSVTFTVPGGVTQVVALCDTSNCTVTNGQPLYFSNAQLEPGNVANRYCGANYSPWLKQVGPITFSRSFTADAGDIVLQNLSGNTIDRDVASAIKAHEFEGALGVLRLYLPLFDDKMFQFHGYLSEQQPGAEEATFRLLQLSDYTQYNVAEDVITDLCTWRYKSAQCGSTGTATSCNKRLIDCQDATRAAQERFNGILLVPPASAIVNPPPVQTTPGPRGPASGGGGAGVGGVHGRMALA